MDTAVITILAITGVGALYVLFPVVSNTYRRFRGARTVVCPETKEPADIEIDAGHAAVTSAVGPPKLRVARCSRWPEHEQCDESCLS